MGIWFLADLHDVSSRLAGYRDAWRRALDTSAFQCTVQERQLLERPIVVTADTAAGCLDMVEACSAAFGGAVESRVAGPLAGFTIAPESGLATLECLVEAASDGKVLRTTDAHWRTAAERLEMTLRLFASVPGLREVSSPLSMAEAIRVRAACGLHETRVGERFHVAPAGGLITSIPCG